jgi:hypothetical protein
MKAETPPHGWPMKIPTTGVLFGGAVIMESYFQPQSRGRSEKHSWPRRVTPRGFVGFIYPPQSPTTECAEIAPYTTMRIILILLFLAAGIPAKANITSNLAFEESSFMANNYYVPSIILQGRYAPSGAASPVNIAYEQAKFPADYAPWRIEEQRYGRDFVLYGIVHDDSPVNVTGVGTVNPIEFGLQVLQWGLDQQLPNGSFACEDTFHSTSFFVEAVSDACLALQNTQYAAKFVGWTAAAALRIHLSAQWMMTVQASYLPFEEQYGHRYWLDAAAFQLSGILTNDWSLTNNAISYINSGYAARLSSGINPELGGYDSSYQAVGMVYACRLYDFLTNKTYLNKVAAMLNRAEAWEESRVLPDGVVNSQGNSRTGSCQETGPNGNCKDIDYPYVFASFYHWSLIRGMTSCADEAELVVQGYSLVLSSP